MKTVFGPNTLVPMSVLGIVFAAAFWIAGLAKDIQAVASEVIRIKSDRDTIEAEIIQQLKSQSITMQEIQLQAARTDTKISTMIELIKKMQNENH